MMADSMSSLLHLEDLEYQAESDSLSDSDLPSGPPSPDASDDEGIRNCSDFGITTPYFFNKLRELTHPLFQKSQDLSPNLNIVHENVTDRSKSSRLKKRNVKDNRNDQSGAIERHYGYIPNPRWPKTLSHSRPFNPRGLTKEDEVAIPGLVFRDSTHADHSYQDSEFPSLNSTSKDDSSFLGVFGDTSTSAHKRLSFDTSHEGKSPVTSTPLRHECPSPHEANLCEKSPAPGNVVKLQKDHLKPDENSTKDEPKNRSGRNNRRRSKKLLLSPLVGTPSKPFEQSLSDSSDFNSSNSVLVNPGSKSLEERRSHLSLSGKNHSLNENSMSEMQQTTCHYQSNNYKNGSFPASNVQALNNRKSGCEREKFLDQFANTSSSFEEKYGINNNNNIVVKSPSWSQIASRGSSPVPWSNSSEGLAHTHKLVQTPLNVDTQQPTNPSWSQVIKASSPAPSPGGSWSARQPGESTEPMGVELIKAKGNRLSDGETQVKNNTTSAATQRCGSFGRTSKNYSWGKASSPAVPVDNLSSCQPANSLQTVNENRPSSPYLETKSASHNSSGNGSRRNSFDNGKGRNSMKQIVERQNNTNSSNSNKGGAKKGEKHRAKLFTLDNFMTPTKGSKENWPNHCAKDINAFENRFVEHIEASATSPPKKVKPSPIKKLNFSLQGDKNSSSESDATQSESIQSEPNGIKTPIFRRQRSLIRDLDWQKPDRAAEESQKLRSNAMTKPTQSPQNSGLVFSLEDYAKGKKGLRKDVLLQDEDDIVQGDEGCQQKIQQFWKQDPIDISLGAEGDLLKPQTSMPDSCLPEVNEEDIYRYYPKSSAVKSNVTLEHFPLDSTSVNSGDVADPSKVTFKAQLKKYARRYCHLVEEHHIASIADEINFVLQLLTPSHLDQETLKAKDLRVGGTVFRSVHNSVYFAVHIIKKLRRLFLCLPFPVLYLLAHNSRIRVFSPKLHACFTSSLSSRWPHTETASPLEHIPFKTMEYGIESFPDTNFAHVFKCQRDNFYALYRQYHDKNGVHPFSMEDQIQYVYDCRTPEQNSITNLMHVTELFLDHLIQCCLRKADEQRKEILQMMDCQSSDESTFEKLLSDFLSNHIIPSTNPSSMGKAKGDGFFIDFIQTLRCPAFNEHLKYLMISRILQLNGKSYGCVRNLHSSVIVGDDKTPERCQDFGSSVLSLCTMAKILGHLVFLPYTSGAQELPVYQEASMLKMREMTPLPLPLPLLLKQAFEDGHLSLTIPWVVDFLSMMDQAAPKLTVYMGLLQRLKSLQRYAWKMLYMNGHQNSGLLTFLSITKLFQTDVVQAHSSLFCEEPVSDPTIEPKGGKYIDVQRLVSSAMLYTCCPHLVESCAPLAAFSMQRNSSRLSRKIVPLIAKSIDSSKATEINVGKDTEDIRQWLGSSIQETNKSQETDKPNGSAPLPIIQRELDLPCAVTHFFPKLDDRIQSELQINYIDGTPYLRDIVNMAVDLLCGKVQEYTLNTILKVSAFEAKREVRSKFLNMEKNDDAQTVKSQVLIHANLLANKMSSEVRYAFFQAGEIACRKDLTQLLSFLASCIDELSRGLVIKIAEDIMVQRLKEWASVQLGPDFFRRLIIREAERCARPNGKPVSMFPSDFSQKLEQSNLDLDVKDGVGDLQQLSEIMDRALSGGVWYINSLTPGPRPDETFMMTLLNDLISCLEKRLVTIDFAFYVMANFLMHLIIQYIMDAPFNWTEACIESFIKLCLLCEDRKMEDDHLSVRLADTVGKTKNVKVKVANLVSVFSLQWIAKSLMLDHSLMVYCQTLVRLVEAGLMMVESVVCKLTTARTSHHLTESSKVMIDRVMLKVLTLLYSSTCQVKTCSPARVLSLVLPLKGKLEEWGSDKALEDFCTVFGSKLM